MPQEVATFRRAGLDEHDLARLIGKRRRINRLATVAGSAEVRAAAIKRRDALAEELKTHGAKMRAEIEALDRQYAELEASARAAAGEVDRRTKAVADLADLAPQALVDETHRLRLEGLAEIRSELETAAAEIKLIDALLALDIDRQADRDQAILHAKAAAPHVLRREKGQTADSFTMVLNPALWAGKCTRPSRASRRAPEAAGRAGTNA